MEQVFRIEIPVEAVDKTDTAALQRLETVLQKIFTSMQRNKTEANDVSWPSSAEHRKQRQP